MEKIWKKMVGGTVFVAILCHAIVIVRANLVISEVYFAGTDEWVEISNTGLETYSGDIELSGAKASSVWLNSLAIEAGKSVVVGDNMSMLMDQSMVLKSGLALNISDTADLNVSIWHSGALLDQISGTAIQISALKSIKSSLQKIVSGNVLVISGVGIEQTQNILPGFFGNPGVLWNYEENQQTSGEMVLGSGVAQIILSEIFFDGYDEWIELANPSGIVYSGDVVIHGVSNLPIDIGHIIIEPGKAIVVTQNMDVFLNTGVVVASGVSLTIQDDASMTASVQSNGVIVDSFQVHVDHVVLWNDQRVSFEKVKFGEQWVVTPASGARTENIISGYIANPGRFFDVDVMPVDASTGVVLEIGTGDVGSGEIVEITGGLQGGDECLAWGTKIRVVEVFGGNDRFSGFVEVEVLEDVSESFLFSGDGLVENFEVVLDAKKGERVVISNSDNGWLSITKVVRNSSLVLESFGGDVFVIGQSGQVLDRVLMSGVAEGFSWYESASGVCLREFFRQERFSPGFDEDIYFYVETGGVQIVEVEKIIEVEKIVEIEKIVEVEKIIETVVYQNSECPPYSGSYQSVEITGTTASEASQSGTQMTGGVDLGGFVRILSIDYDPPGSDIDIESIVLRSYNNAIVDLETLRVHSLNRTTKNRIYGLLEAGSTIVITGNFAFPNVANCVELLSGDVVLDRYCYPQTGHVDIMTGTVDTGSVDNLTENTGAVDDSRQHVITIQNLVYDPDGSDTDRESIVLKLLSGNDVNVENFELIVGTRKTKLWYSEMNSGSALEHGVEKMFTGNFRFPNSEKTCVSLVLEDLVYGSYCYDPAEKDIITEEKAYPVIKISQIVYDPPGNDGENEVIGLELVSGGPVNLSSLHLSVGGQKRKLVGMLENKGETLFYGGFRFPNSKDTCVSLIEDEHIFDTLCYTIVEKEDEEKVNDEKNYVNTVIKIKNIIFDPEGADTGREQIVFVLESAGGTGNEIDLADGFYLEWGSTRKSLKTYGKLFLGEERTLEGSFGFPNSRNECVELVREDLVFDKICYEISENEAETGDAVEEVEGAFDGKISIRKVLPNPVGSDQGNEEVTLIFAPGVQVKGPIDLKNGFRLKIGNTNRNLSGVLFANKEVTLNGNFGLPNKAGCVSLTKDGNELDKFCYDMPEEGELFEKNNGVLSSVSTIDLGILQKVSLKKGSDRICVWYQEQKIYCKKYSFKTVNSNELKLYKNYITEMNSYLSNNWSTLFFNSPLQYYRELLSDAKNMLKSGKDSVDIDGKSIKVYDIKTQAKLTIFSSPSELLKRKVVHWLLGQKN